MELKKEVDFMIKGINENIVKEYINNIEQLSADLRYKVNNNNYDLKVELESIKEWVKLIERRIKRID